MAERDDQQTRNEAHLRGMGFPPDEARERAERLQEQLDSLNEDAD